MSETKRGIRVIFRTKGFSAGISAIVLGGLFVGAQALGQTSGQTTHKVKHLEQTVAPTAAPTPLKAATPTYGFKFGGFIDAQGLLTNRKDYQTRGFTLNDAALYISKDFSSELSAFVDLPFATPSGAHTNSVGFAEGKAQAYFLFTRADLTTHFGQFDTPFGFEKNDSKDRFFADAGAIKTYIVPQTHTGVMTGYRVGNLTMSGLLANPHDQGTMADTNPEIGAQIKFDLPSQEAFVQFGLLMGEQDVPSSNKTNLLIELLGMKKWNAYNFAASYHNKKTAGTDKTANVFGALGTFDMNPLWNWGARLEYMTDATLVVAGVNNLTDHVMTLSVGPAYKLTNEVTLRGDLSMGNFDYPSPTEDVTVYGATISVLATL
jgi:hypothetical protein